MKRLEICTLSKGWKDRDSVMLHACFQILVDFMEKEADIQVHDWKSDKDRAFAMKEFKALYRWWKYRDQTKGDMIEKITKRYGYGPKYSSLIDKLDQQDQDNLIRLVKVRPFMWT